jgi:hypothetical protein
MKDKIIERIIKKTGVPNIMDILVDRISLTDLQSLLLKVYQEKLKKEDASSLLGRYKSNRFVQPSTINPQHLIAFDKLAFKILPQTYEVLELSPVGPLGTCSALGPVSQNNVLTTVRNTEVCADTTNILALESALRRRELLKLSSSKNQDSVRLSSSQRLLRTQTINEPAAVPHFKVFSLCAAGRDSGSFRFEMEHLAEQLTFYLNLLGRLKEIHITITAIRILFILFNHKVSKQLDELKTTIKSKYPKVGIEINLENKKQNYYTSLRYNIFATNNKGEEYFLCDGGFTDWTQQLLQNRKERYLISGFGSERLFLVF